MSPTDPTPLPCQTPRTDAATHCDWSGGAEATEPEVSRQLETELAQAEAEAAAMREWVQESVVVSMEFADGRVLTKADLLATTAGAELLERLRKAEALAAQMSAEREHNAMEALAMRAERDELRGKLSRECSNHDVTRDVLIEADGREIRLIAERDAANALVAAIKREADKLHEECIRDGETDAYCLTSNQIEALTKHFLPTTTENTKPQ